MPACIHDLPDGVLESILGLLDCGERHRSIILVCQRWNQAVRWPALQRSLRASLSAGKGQFRPRLNSLSAWLRHVSAAHLEKLWLSLDEYNYDGRDDRTEALLEGCKGELISSLAACSRLHTLDLSIRSHQHDISAWVAPLHSLQRLDTHATGDDPTVEVNKSLGHLTALEHWGLDAGLTFRMDMDDPAIQLPPFLTSLDISYDNLKDGDRNAMLFGAKVGALSKLRSLSLYMSEYGAEEYIADLFTPFTRFTALTRLEILERYWDFFPDCLSQLTTLRSLAVINKQSFFNEEDFELIDGALPHLQQLTSLALGICPYVPSTLSSLLHLRSLRLTTKDPDEELRAGPWLANLCEFAAYSDFIAWNLPALETAPELEAVELICGRRGISVDDMLEIVEWAAQHPSLHSLIIQAERSPHTVVDAAIAEAQQARPALQFVFEDPEPELY